MRTPEERQAEREAQAAGAIAQEGALSQFQQQFDDPTFWGSGEGDYARFDPTYGLQLRGVDGAFQNVGLGEHAESNSYLQAAAEDPMYDRFIAYANQHAGSLTPEQKQLMTLVGGDTWGQSKLRGWGAIDPYASELTGHQAGTMLQTGYGDSLTPEQRQSGSHFNWYESPAQQSARSDDGGFLGLGDAFGPLAMMAAMYFLGPAAGAAGEIGAASAVELAAADAAAGIGAFGEAFPAAITADIGAATAGNMGYDAAANLGEQAFQTSPLGSLKELYNGAKPYLDAASTAKKVYNVYGALTQDPKAPAVQVGGLQQSTQPQQGYQPSRAFGYNNFNAVRG